MKQINLLKYVLVGIIFIYATACEKDVTNNKEPLPSKVRSEFLERYPESNIKDFDMELAYFSDERMWGIYFTDKTGTQSKACYKQDGTWKLTTTEMNSIDDLSFWAKHTFMKLYADANIESISKTERDGVLGSLYLLYFLSEDRLVHHVLINDDGLHLATYNSQLVDTYFINDLPISHFEFIERKYEDAEIRAYLLDSGAHQYIIKHEDKIKTVSFELDLHKGFWRETEYKLDKDYPLPDNVIKFMEINHPGFEWTSIDYFEREDGNEFLLWNEGPDRKYGYTVSEDCE